MEKQKQSEIGRLAQTLQIKLNTRVMLAVNIDFQDRLVNDLLGTVKHMTTGSQGSVTKLCINFDDLKAEFEK